MSQLPLLHQLRHQDSRMMYLLCPWLNKLTVNPIGIVQQPMETLLLWEVDRMLILLTHLRQHHLQWAHQIHQHLHLHNRPPHLDVIQVVFGPLQSA